MATPNFDDPIDWVEHYWRKQSLGDPRKFLAMGSLLRLHQLMTSEIDRGLKEFDLTRSGYLALSTIQLSENASGCSVASQRTCWYTQRPSRC